MLKVTPLVLSPPPSPSAAAAGGGDGESFGYVVVRQLRGWSVRWLID